MEVSGLYMHLARLGRKKLAATLVCTNFCINLAIDFSLVGLPVPIYCKHSVRNSRFLPLSIAPTCPIDDFAIHPEVATNKRINGKSVNLVFSGRRHYIRGTHRKRGK